MAFWNKKKKQQPALTRNLTFKEKTKEFWKWYSDRSQFLLDTIEDGRCRDLQPEISDAVNQMWKSFAWVFGPGSEEKGGHSFTLSGEGILHRQFLTKYWLKQAPQLDAWTFYSSRQPGELSDGMSMSIGGHSIEFGGLWVTPTLDEENEKVDIAAWHPVFENAETSVKNTALFVILDEVLGEFGTDSWLGEIKTTDKELADAMPVSELRDYLHDLELNEDWQKGDPTERISLYELSEPDDSFLRSDSFSGAITNMQMVGEYLDSKGNMEDPLEGSGAEFVFIACDSQFPPECEQVDFRYKLEEAMDAALAPENSGQVLGGAMGQTFIYIDILIFDGERSLNLIKDELIRQKLPAGTTIHFFAAGNEGRRVVL